MFVQVKLLAGLARPLTYKVPDQISNIVIGSLVRVPLRNRIVPAVVIDLLATKPSSLSYEIKELTSLEPLPYDPWYASFIEQIAQMHALEPHSFFNRMTRFLQQKEVHSLELPSAETQPHEVTLTDEQQRVVDFVTPTITAPSYTPVLLHGVTGSGKTEVYKKLILTAFEQRKTTLLLLPEVTLATSFETLLKKQLPTVDSAGFHSASSAKSKQQLWAKLKQQKPMLIIGVHLPCMLPIPNLGLIIVDEEHEIGFQEKKHPKINSKHAALMRAKIAGIPIVLGSATPSVSSLYNVKTKGWHFFQLKKRFAGAFASTTIVPLTGGMHRTNFWISAELQRALKERIERKEQSIVFLNRRGAFFFVQCKQCSFVFSCSCCSVSLTLHNTHQLQCHYCGFKKELPPSCPSCSASEQSFLKKGIGTQTVVAILEKLFPHACIARADADATVNKKQWQATMQAMNAGQIDILVGTQTITKGYHFPKVTLVGVLWADLALNFPVFNAGEVALQQLIQVAGRAGRQTESSTVIIQTMIDHPIFTYINEIDYLQFYAHEIEQRIALDYPPYKRLVELEIKNKNPEKVEADAHNIAQQLKKIGTGCTVLGPAKPPVHTISNMHSRKIYLKGESYAAMRGLFDIINKDGLSSSCVFTPDPLSM